MKLHEALSKWSTLTSRIPQGSVLGPILFFIYTFDTSKSFYSKPPLDNWVYISSFADDTKYFSDPHLDDNCLKLESTLTSLLNWSQRNYMYINIDKFNILHLGKILNQNYSYSIDTITLHQTSLIKDMGVLMDDQLDLTAHIAKISLERNRICGLVKQTTDIFKKVFTFLIRPKLENASQV